MQEKLEDLKHQLLQQQRRRLYQAYLWEGRRYSWDEEDVISSHEKLAQEIDRMKDEYEGWNVWKQLTENKTDFI